MPYNVRKVKEGKWVTYNTDTGDVKGTHTSREDALKQMRLLYHVKGGGELTKAI